MLSLYRPRVRSVVEVETRREIPAGRGRQQSVLDVSGAVIRLRVFAGVLRPDFQVARRERDRDILRAEIALHQALGQRDVRGELTESPELAVLVVSQVA